MRVAVNTPTGHIGGVLSEHLLNAGVDLVLPARHPDKLARIAERGALVHQGDLQDPDFVAEVTKGVDVLFWLTPPNLAADDFRGFQNTLGKNAARAVKENRIPRVVDVSSIGAQHGSGTGPIAGLGDVERTLEGTGAFVTHLRPAYFMENYLTAVPTIVSDGAVYL
ncbi:MAG: NAD(P)H-binding protein, partial [bacterium]